MTNYPYQYLPPLKPEKYTEIRESIRVYGVLSPIEKDEDGNILDGHHRIKMCDELGIKEYPITIRAGMSEAEKIRYTITVNENRRPSGDENKKYAALKLREERLPTGERKYSLRQIAEMVEASVGSVHAWVSTVQCLNSCDEELDEEPKPDRVMGKDGKSRPSHHPFTITARNAREEQAAKEALGVIGWEGSKHDIKTAYEMKEEATRAKREQNRAQVESVNVPPPVESVTFKAEPNKWYALGSHLLFCGDSTSDVFTSRAPKCPFAFADPPYNVDKTDWDNGFLWSHDWLTERAEVVAVTPGTKEMQRFFRVCQMPYKWVFWAWIDNGMTVGSMGFQNTLFALLFAKGSIHRNVQDGMRLSIDNSTTKDTKHPTRKPAAFVARLVQIYSDEGDTVIDPFLGSGTTLFVADEMNRSVYGAEINLEYCAEIIERWQNKTGDKAVALDE